MIRAVVLAIVTSLLVASVALADAVPIVGTKVVPSGPGWRLVAERTVNNGRFAFVVRAAMDRAAFANLWNELDSNDPPRTDIFGAPTGSPVDFEREIVVLFGVGIGSCTTGVDLDDVVIDAANRMVYSVTTEHSRCGFLDLTGAKVFLVALDRGVMPPSPFTVQLHARPTCHSCADPEDRMTVSVGH